MENLVCNLKPSASKIIIEGRRQISGEIKIQGSKNAALPMLAASILNKGITRLSNCPNIGDVEDILQLLEKIGCRTEREKDVVIIDASNLTTHEIPRELAEKTRGSFVMLGALLSREKCAKVPYPGGCPIGSRPVDIHLNALSKMGMELSDESETACAVFKKKDNVSVKFSYPSVGATENCIFAAVLGDGKTTLKNCAREPEITDLCCMLNAMGADISGVGTSVLHINGVRALHDVEWRVSGDRIVAATYMTAALISNGSITIKGVPINQISNEINIFAKTGAAITMWGDVLHIRRSNVSNMLYPIRRIVTKPYPGFPTDMQSQIMSLLVFADGRSTIKENIFENRFKIVEELTKMGADITVSGKKAVINGTGRIYGADIIAKDLRGGAALVLAALGAEGVSTISGYSHIKRGYENFVDNLSDLGVSIKESV